jgi:hypothetical protein
MLHQAEFGLGREQRVVDMRGEVGRNRLETRLRKACHQKAKGSLSEEIGLPTGMFDRSVAFAAALFR